MENEFLFKQIITSTIKKLKSDGVNIIQILTNQNKVLDNMKIYKNTNSEIIKYIDNVKKDITENKGIEIITIVKDNISDVMSDYIIGSIITESANFFAINGHSTLDIVEYVDGLSSEVSFSHKKVLLADLRNLHIKKPLEQELFLINLLKLVNKRNVSRLYNVIIIDEKLKDIINDNDLIKGFISNTKIIK